MVKLCCGVYGEASVFSLDIELDNKVEELQGKLAGILSIGENIVLPRSVALYLARKEGETEWLTDDANLYTLLGGDVDKQYPRMPCTWRLDDKELLGPDFTTGDKKIHVLVALTDLPNKRFRGETVLDIERFEEVPHANINEQYVTLPAAFLETCGFKVPGDLMLYCRREVRDLWNFLQNEVVAKNARGFIVGPPGTGKSVSTLSFVTSLNQQEWNVVWIHLGPCLDSCVVMGTKEYWYIPNLSSFELPRVSGKKLFICLDGYKATDEHKAFFKRILRLLDKKNERLVLCSSMATLGKINVEDYHTANIQFFFVNSWTKDDYLAAIGDQTFYDTIKANLDATGTSEVNEDGVCDAEWSEEDKKMHALDLKFYYAGGSCRFMFQYPTDKVMSILVWGVRSTANKSDLVKYCVGEYHQDTINRLYGMHYDGLYSQYFPVSSYTSSLFASECDEETILELGTRLNASDNPSVDGHLFEWLFLASVAKRAVKLFSDGGVEEVLPKANVLRFDPKKRFKKLVDGKLRGDRSWLQPVTWNQGGYDAVYFDQDKGQVIFVQITRSDKHDFKMLFFYRLLLKLSAGMKINEVVVYFVVKPSQCINFKIGNVDGRDLLCKYDDTWTKPEENHVRVRAFEASPV